MQAPFDGRFKILAEEHPELLLRLLGIVEPGMKPEFIHVLRELLLDPVEVDHIYRVGDEGEARLVHLEAITSWSRERTSRLALYRFLLRQKHKIPVVSYVVLMAEKYAPKRMPARVVYQEPDGFRIEAPYQVIRLWEIDPSIAFEHGGEPLLPWAPLLKGGRAELMKTVERIEELAEHPEEAPYPLSVMVSNLATLAGLRYDKDVVQHTVERLRTKMMLDTELFTDTWLYKDGVKAGRKEAKLEAKREALRVALDTLFPELGEAAEFDQISSPKALDRLLVAVLKAKTVDEVRSAITAASRA